MYILISTDGDGKVRVREINVEAELAELVWVGGERDFFTALPDQTDPCMWGGRQLIIKGGVVSPRATNRVLTYEID